MTKKRPSVILPGGIAGLVHQVQNGGEEPQKSNESANRQQEQAAPATKKEDSPEAMSAETVVERPSVESAPAASSQERVGESAPEVAPEKPRRGRPAAPKENITPTEKAEKEYHIVKDSGADSWELFLSLGRIYKTRDERLATIYIDPDLKRILDRLKTASNVKLPTAAILSSIVARFIFDHEKKINDVIFGERLI